MWCVPKATYAKALRKDDWPDQLVRHFWKENRRKKRPQRAGANGGHELSTPSNLVGRCCSYCAGSLAQGK